MLAGVANFLAAIDDILAATYNVMNNCEKS